MKKNWTGERLESFIFSRDAIEHLHRYGLVFNYIENKIVLDIACGEGYGSHLMSEKAAAVHAVDIDKATVLAAKAKYKKDNLSFMTGNATSIPLASQSVDVVVSFETIEHHDQHEEMIAEIRRVLKPGGLLIISTPDKLYYSDKRNFNNKFHVKELYKAEFVDLIIKVFPRMQLLTQKYCNGNSIIQDEITQEKIQFYTGNYTKVIKREIDPLYLIAIASDVDFELQQTTFFDGSEMINKELLGGIYASRTFKVGHFILRPFKIFKKLLR
ncbi:MAG: class I SAM-dependent methyltransferase [Methylotenera sp.]|nr:class I SAM-dependent methyltransferase [Flavobacterium sp.]